MQRNAKNVVRLNFHLIMHVILVVITRQNGLNCPEKGELITFVFTGALNARLELEDQGLKYVCGEVKLDEGPSINAVILGINKKKAREITDKLPVRVRPVFHDMGRYTTLFFELDE